MANKWDENTGWAYADWSDEERNPLMSFLWDSLKNASAERVAFMNQSHDSSFPADHTFPDYNTDKSLPLSSDHLKIKNGVYPFALSDGVLMNNDDMSAVGTVTSNADIPNAMTLTTTLDETGYGPDFSMLHSQDTSNGSDTALARMAWVVQWFKIMDYYKWTNWPVAKDGGAIDSTWVSDIEFQQYRMFVTYYYDYGSSTFISASAKERQPRFTSPEVDLYVAGDLNEVAPFSTTQQVRDYAISKFNPDGAGWVSTNNATSIKIGCTQEEASEKTVASTDHTVQIVLDQARVRFKVNDAYRAVTPNRFTPDIWWFLYYSEEAVLNVSPRTFSDFGEGFAENDKSLVKLTADGSGWYYLESDPDFDHEPVVVEVVAGDPRNLQIFAHTKKAITPDMNYTDFDNSFYIDSNKTDESAFEYYTPAP